jgi:hypothetical protein
MNVHNRYAQSIHYLLRLNRQQNVYLEPVFRQEDQNIAARHFKMSYVHVLKCPYSNRNEYIFLLCMILYHNMLLCCYALQYFVHTGMPLLVK